jgi:hypothetical protein
LKVPINCHGLKPLAIEIIGKGLSPRKVFAKKSAHRLRVAHAEYYES